MKALKLIINADDLGASPQVNEAIFESMGQGAITSATLLANGPAIAAAVAGVSRYPRCSFGAHLNLSDFHPLTRSAELNPLLDAEGRFMVHRLRQVKIDSVLAEAIHNEWDAQVGLLRSSGVRLSHLDSHHHVHTIPRLFPMLKRVQARHALRKVRISTNLYPSGQRVRPLLLLKKRVWNAALRHYGRSVTTQGFSDLRTFYEVARGRSLAARSFELMVHPGDPGRVEENGLLRRNWRDDLGFETKLINYDELGGAGQARSPDETS